MTYARNAIRLHGWTTLVALVFALPSWGGEPPKPPVDLYGDPLPDGAVVRFGTVRFRHPGAVHAVAFSPDGKLIAASSNGLTNVILWERASGRKLREFPGGGRPHPWAQLRFSPDSKRLYGSLMHNRDKPLYAWDVGAGAYAKDMPPLPVNADVLGFSLDAREVILLERKGEIVRWDIDKGKERGRYPKPEHDAGIAALVGERVLVAQFDGQTVGIWDAAGKKQLWSAKMTRDKNWPLRPIAFSPDGKLFAFEAPPQGIVVHESVGGKLVRQLKADVKKIYYSVGISPDRRTVVGSNMDGSLRIWDLESGRERVQPPPQGGWCHTFFTPDSKMFATSWGSGVARWDTATGTRIVTPGEQSGQITSVSFSPDGKIAATSSYFGGHPGVQLWDVQTGQTLRSFDPPSENGIPAVAFSPDGRTLAACGFSAKEQVWIWDVCTGRQRHALNGHEADCTCLAFSADGKRLASGDKYYNRKGQWHGRLCIWDVESGKRLREIRGTQGAIQSVLFTPDGRHILAAANGVHVYDADTGQLIGKPFLTKRMIQGLDLSADGRLLVIAEDIGGSVRLCELATRREIPLAIPGANGGSVAVTRDGRTLIASSSTGQIRVFHWPSGKAAGSLSNPFHDRTHVFLSPDGRRLATAWHSDSTALIWDVAEWVNQPLPTVAKPTEADLRSWWTALRDDSPTEAYKAVWRFVAAGEQVLPFLATSLPPIKPVESDTVARLIDNLDSDQFEVREKASRELSRLGEVVVDALRKEKNGNSSPEQMRRIDQLLAELAGPVPGPEQLRAIRAVAILEQIGGAEARKSLAKLAAGAAGARLTQEAQAGSERLKRSARDPSRARSAAK